VGRPELEALIAETVAFREKLALKLKRGRDRLLELNSFDRAVAEGVLARVRAADADPFLRNFIMELLDHFGVRLKEHEEGDVFLDRSHAYIEGFPSIPADGMLATFSRARAIVREDIRFVSADHSLVQDAIDLLIESKAGTTAFGAIEADAPNLVLEAIFVLETVAETRWHVDQFLAPTPVRVVVDLRGEDLTAEHPVAATAADFEERDVHRFLEQPGFNAGMLKEMIDAATARADSLAQAVRREARARAAGGLTADLKRLTDLQRVNDHVRPEEIALAQERLKQTDAAIAQARLRLDAVRLIVLGDSEEW
jgi:ATP-dependent helicase HepA